jgi:RNA polymerase sigma-70 factor, ECF subfamily
VLGIRACWDFFTLGSSQREKEFIELLSDCQSRVMGCIYALVHNMQDAEEVYQQTCLTLWRKFDVFQPGTDFAKWACSVAYLEVMGFLRRTRDNRVRFSDEFIAELVAWEGEQPADDTDRRLASLRECMELLADRDRQLIDLRYAAVQAVVDIARQLGRTPQSICNSLGRVRASLLECIRRKLAREDYA